VLLQADTKLSMQKGAVSMTMLAEQTDGVIGVDTHRDTLTAAAVTPVGGLRTVPCSPMTSPVVSRWPAPGHWGGG
jgi:hypothetical protein